VEDLSKDIEEGRAARRARAQALVAAGWTPPELAKAPKPRPRKSYTPKQLDRLITKHRDACEAQIAEAASESGMHPDEFWCDIVRSYELVTEWEAPSVRADFLRGYGLEPKDLF
jgi:tRNA A-37 threonylcarbamoyl transferase component Bud32